MIVFYIFMKGKDCYTPREEEIQRILNLDYISRNMTGLLALRNPESNIYEFGVIGKKIQPKSEN